MKKKPTKITKKTNKKENKKSKYDYLFYKTESAWTHLTEKDVMNFSDNYKKFLDNTKTEREAVNIIESIVLKHGFKDFSKLKSIKKGDKIFQRTNKNIVLMKIGSLNKMRAIVSHLDSPRLDLKPNPIFQDSDIALLKSHYYGGIKKYHWVNRPLAIHGIVILKNGTKKNIVIGESKSDPVLVIPDLLPHLAKNQYEKKVSEFIGGEDLNIIIGNLPTKDKKIEEKIKLTALKFLHDKYGMTEKDFTTAELEIVPAETARDVGFDGSMVGAYGQDDSVCAYTSMNAMIESKNSSTIAALFVDKEEIGSEGKSGAKSKFFFNFLNQVLKKMKSKEDAFSILQNAEIISADVTAGMNPNFKDVQELRNVSFIGRGVAVEKYGGGGGKYSTNDADAEYTHKVMALLDKNKVRWQTGELGKIDIGGGGTVAMFFAEYGCDIIDVGPPVLGMHSPFEILSKADVYSAYQAYKVFYEQK